MRILITGAGGQLGHELFRKLKDHDLVPLDHKEGDVSRPEIIRTIEQNRPDIIIHGAAYTDVDGCETNADQAFLVNALGTRHVALGARRVDADLVYISTDYVFDGKKGSPYTEFDEPNPLNVYGASKLAGEYQVQHLTNRYYIVRSSWLYGLEGKNFVKTVLRLAKEQETLKIVNDQVGSPTYVKDLAIAISELIQTKLYGTYHAAAEGSCSWYEFAGKILKLSNIQKEVIPITSKELNRPAMRPAYSVLRNMGFGQMGFKIRDWKEQIQDCLKELRY